MITYEGTSPRAGTQFRFVHKACLVQNDSTENETTLATTVCTGREFRHVRAHAYATIK